MVGFLLIGKRAGVEIQLLLAVEEGAVEFVGLHLVGGVEAIATVVDAGGMAFAVRFGVDDEIRACRRARLGRLRICEPSSAPGGPVGGGKYSLRGRRESVGLGRASAMTATKAAVRIITIELGIMECFGRNVPDFVENDVDVRGRDVVGL